MTNREYSKFEILNFNHQDYQEGFEVLCEPSLFINWNMVAGELLEKGDIYFEIDKYKKEFANFKSKIRIGNIIFDGLYFHKFQHRYDVPVLNFFADIVNVEETDKTYRILNKKLFDDVGSHRYRIYLPEDQTQVRSTFDLDKMILSLVYSYNSDCRYTILKIENKRDYSELLKNEEEVEISNALVLETEIEMYGNYKEDVKIKWRPDELNNFHQKAPVIWMDRSNNTIGFSDNLYSQRYFLSEIENIFIQNIYPAKCGGGSELYLFLKKDKQRKKIFSAPYSVFDKYAEELSNCTGLQVVFGKEYPCD
ncbi:hypothetical protein [Persicitalea sp.]|uniref:hypothetical protein n=1 Tax=Persicitalea sp. TaxID=3100273 RepID=UPI00359319DB